MHAQTLSWCSGYFPAAGMCPKTRPSTILKDELVKVGRIVLSLRLETVKMIFPLVLAWENSRRVNDFHWYCLVEIHKQASKKV